MLKIKSKLLFLFILLLSFNCCAQSKDTVVVAFWNLQNLFDTVDDPQKEDEEFLPDGTMQWTEERLDTKIFNLSRVIRMMNNNKGPDLLGVCEVENEAVLDSLINKFLPDLNFKIAYLESPDNRGIDNVLLYKAKKFKLLNIQADTVHLSDSWPTRLIFAANLLTSENEKITVFVNHWPSRSGGQSETEPNRIEAARTLRYAVDRIFNSDSMAKIIIIGDFNDDPINKSLLETLNAFPIICDSLNSEFNSESNNNLYNLSYYDYAGGLGSFKYKDTWNLLDQIIVSKSLITAEDLFYICNSFEVYKPDFMVTKSGKYKGTPYPTYGGKNYLGGYSDHFPVIAKFIITRNMK